MFPGIDCLHRKRRPDLALEHFEIYLRLCPLARFSTYLNGIGEAYFFSRRFDEAAANLLASLELAPVFPLTYRVLASCWAYMGRLDEAREIVRGGCTRSRLQ